MLVLLMVAARRASSGAFEEFEAALPSYARPFARATWDAALSRSLDPYLFAAVIDHESRFGQFLVPKGPGGTGDGGNGLGLGQIDKRYHSAWAASHDWRDPAVNLRKAAEILAAALAEFPTNSRAGLSRYNASAERIRQALAEGRDPQSVTTRGAYVDEVFARLAIIRPPMV